MKHSPFAARAITALLLAATLLPVGTLAASTTAVQVKKDTSATSAAQAAGSSESPVTVDQNQATGSFQVVYQDQTGSETTSTVTAVSPSKELYACVTTGSDTLRVRQGPGTNYAILTSVYDGDLFLITGKVNGWYQIAINDRTGYVSAQYVVEKNLEEVEEGNPSDPADNPLAQQIVDYALQYQGYPYVYGTAGPNTFDCSGFTSYVYAHFGYTLNRSSKDQLKNGVAITKDQLQPADLVLFSANGSVVTHVGLYIGDGKIIHASTATTGVIISDLYSTYYVNHYYAARRIL
jgi:cell wall-associated NlpC family hydrolase